MWDFEALDAKVLKETQLGSVAHAYIRHRHKEVIGIAKGLMEKWKAALASGRLKPREFMLIGAATVKKVHPVVQGILSKLSKADVEQKSAQPWGVLRSWIFGLLVDAFGLSNDQAPQGLLQPEEELITSEVDKRYQIAAQEGGAGGGGGEA